MNSVIFIAPPAAGKGSMSEELIKRFNYTHISTGDLLREEVKSGTDLGKSINEVISSGNLVSDDIINKLIDNKITNLKDQLFILDGYPRTIDQAKHLDELLSSNNITNVIAIYLDVEYSVLLKRVTGRRTCPKCKKTYNIYFDEFKPKVEGLCDECNTPLESRSDDTKDTFKARYNTYINNTEPIIEFYKNKGVLNTIKCTNNFNSDLDKVIEVCK